VTLIIDTPIGVTLDAAALKNGTAFGYINSGWSARHTGQPMITAYVSLAISGPRTKLQVEILGEFRDAEGLGALAYDLDWHRAPSLSTGALCHWSHLGRGRWISGGWRHASGHLISSD
jgi:hypothetical protein